MRSLEVKIKKEAFNIIASDLKKTKLKRKETTLRLNASSPLHYGFSYCTRHDIMEATTHMYERRSKMYNPMKHKAQQFL